MTPPAHLGPGSQVPAWIEDLDRLCFGDAWDGLGEAEHLWQEPGVGFARWRVLERIGEAELLRVAVRPERRRAGGARALLAHCQAELARMGVAELHLEVRESNLGARRLYESLGWTQRGRRPGYYRDGEDAALYGLELPHT